MDRQVASWSRTTATTAAAVDQHNNDGDSCGGCTQQQRWTRTAVAVYAHSSDDGLRWTRTATRWTHTTATMKTAMDVHSSDDGNYGGRAQQRWWRCRTTVPTGATRRG
ncbi:hypothetical protein DEO72_LG9g1987 [Vigna unguiculata]|uniref:Uncharacterized protein n=1 Tax=Vigna unguiculata TaxID=3917 RepID=A0A4D6N1Z0_VIGUN|nr:hypothetical protein DEO72_LG9g1987 [Vigna unguiculata]